MICICLYVSRLVSIKELFNFLNICSRPCYRSTKLPPGPYRYPVIGNILDVGQKPHESITKLSKIYGPLMSLKLGNITTTVISSAQLAKEVTQKHDQCLYGRANPAVSEVYGHNKVSMIWFPTTDNRWRILRKICKNHMFSQQRLDETQCLHQESLRKLCGNMQECCTYGRVVDVCSMPCSISLNLITSSLFSRDLSPLYSCSNESQDVVMEIVKVLVKGIATTNIADYFPIFKFVDPQGIKRQAKAYVGKMFAILDDIISQRMEAKRRTSMDFALTNDLLDVLLDFSSRNGSELPQN